MNRFVLSLKACNSHGFSGKIYVSAYFFLGRERLKKGRKVSWGFTTVAQMTRVQGCACVNKLMEERGKCMFFYSFFTFLKSMDDRMVHPELKITRILNWWFPIIFLYDQKGLKI